MRALVLLSVVFLACGPTIRSRGLKPAAAAPQPGMAMCRVNGELSKKPLAMGLATLSFATWNVFIGSVLIRHPKGLVLLDPAFGSRVADDIKLFPLWRRALIAGDARTKTPIVDGLERAGVDPRTVRQLIITHAHWDHAGGIADFPKAALLISEPEWAHVQSLRHAYEEGTMKHMFAKA